MKPAHSILLRYEEITISAALLAGISRAVRCSSDTVSALKNPENQSPAGQKRAESNRKHPVKHWHYLCIHAIHAKVCNVELRHEIRFPVRPSWMKPPVSSPLSAPLSNYENKFSPLNQLILPPPPSFSFPLASSHPLPPLPFLHPLSRCFAGQRGAEPQIA